MQGPSPEAHRFAVVKNLKWQVFPSPVSPHKPPSIPQMCVVSGFRNNSSKAGTV